MVSVFHLHKTWSRKPAMIFSSPGTKCQVTYYGGTDSGVRRRASSCSVNNCFKDLLLLNYLAKFNQITQECPLGSPIFRFLQMMTPGPKMAPPRDLSVFRRKILKHFLLRNYSANFYQISEECSLGGPLSDSFRVWPPGRKWPRPGAHQFSTGRY